jgi:hypothetical protein
MGVSGESPPKRFLVLNETLPERHGALHWFGLSSNIFLPSRIFFHGLLEPVCHAFSGGT